MFGLLAFICQTRLKISIGNLFYLFVVEKVFLMEMNEEDCTVNV